MGWLMIRSLTFFIIAIRAVCSVNLPERDQFGDTDRAQALLFRDCRQGQDILHCMQER